MNGKGTNYALHSFQVNPNGKPSDKTLIKKNPPEIFKIKFWNPIDWVLLLGINYYQVRCLDDK